MDGIRTSVLALLMASLGACSSMGGHMASSQQAPGTPSRPVLSAQEAAGLTQVRYFAHSGKVSAPLADPWTPAPIEVSHVQPDFVVGAGAPYATVQQAVNAAIKGGKTTRQYIQLLPGSYVGAVYVPIDAPPLTIYGAGSKPEAVTVQLALDARVLPASYVKTVNPAGQFQPGDPAWTMYALCANLPADKVIDTPCAAVVWSQGKDFQLKNLTITNALLDTVDAATHQAVALRTDGDRTQLENVRLIGRQDTFFVNAGEAPSVANKLGSYPTDLIARAYVKNSYIEGDVDFVFGRANAVFEQCEFRVVSSRRKEPVYVFAPDTVPASSLGFLVMNSRITGDAYFQTARTAKLGRSWDQGASGTGYLPGKSPNGQLLIRDSYIDSSFDTQAPWGEAATTNRPHVGQAAADRKLDDPAFNRLWEFNNKGPGAERK